MTKHIIPGQKSEPVSSNHGLFEVPQGEHLSDEQFEQYALGLLSEEDVENLDLHLKSCRKCAGEIEHLKEVSGQWMRSETRASVLSKLGAEIGADRDDGLMNCPANVRILLRRLSHNDSDIRMAAARALGQLPSEAWSQEWSFVLCVPLVDEHAGVRAETARAVGMLGPTSVSQEIMHALETCLSDEESDVRSAAAEAFGALGPLCTPTVLKTLLCRLGDENWHVRAVVTQALGRLARAAAPRELIDALLPRLKDTSAGVRKAAIGAFGAIGSGTPELMAALQRCLDDCEPEVSRAAAQTLERLDFGPKKIIIIVIKPQNLGLRPPTKKGEKGAALSSWTDGESDDRTAGWSKELTKDGHWNFFIATKQADDIGRRVRLSIGGWFKDLKLERGYDDRAFIQTQIRKEDWTRWPLDEDFLIEIFEHN